jgi:hypothetical protein
VESSCELGNEPSGSIKCWELPRGCTTCGLSSGTQLNRVSYLLNYHHDAEWTSFQTHCYSEYLVALGNEPGASGTTVNNSDH